jgi:hypothetical protein
MTQSLDIRPGVCRVRHPSNRRRATGSPQAVRPYPEPLKQLRYARSKAMTICIAAHAEHLGERKIVLCLDWLVGDDISSTETTFKCDPYFAPGMTAMFAGLPMDAKDLLRIYKKRFTSTVLTPASYKEELWAGMQEFNDMISRLTYRDRSDVQLIVSGFIEKEPLLLCVDSYGIAEPLVFHAIGSGQFIVEAILRWRKPSLFSTLREVLYCVYEAKRLAEEAGGRVGKLTSILVIEQKPEGGIAIRTLKPKGFDVLEADFERWGPKPFAPDHQFPWTELFPE